MFHLIQSNKMATLAAHLVTNLEAQDKEGLATPLNVLQPRQILVQSPGMAQWIKLFVAQQTGIAANLDFPLPSSFIWQLYRRYIPDLPEQSAFTKPNMTWKLMQLLPKFLQHPSFSAIRDYLQDNDAVKCYQLCHKIADVFDQYLVYRPDWISQWESGEDALADTEVAQQPWQPILWRALVEETRRLDESPYHRANLHHTLLGILHDSVQGSIPALHVFGISALPQQQLEVLEALAHHTDVFVYWFNPSMHYWGDIIDEKTLARFELNSGKDKTPDYREVGNPLLASWGKLGRDFLDMLLQRDMLLHDDFDESPPDSLLSHVQYEILQLRHRDCGGGLSAEELLGNGVDYPKFEVSADDTSLVVHACHSKLRELEILKDHLLHAFEADPTLLPGDIVVMMPDVAAYAPYIDGIFAADATPSIPYAVTDRTAIEESGILTSFIQLMQLHQSRLQLSDILTVLDVGAIRRQFSLSETEYEQIKFWLADAGVRWGWDAEDKTRWGVPPEEQNTWLFGLRRLLSGFAMHGEQVLRAPAGFIVPYEHVEGQGSIALGKLYAFCELLIETLEFCQTSGTLADKTEIAHAYIARYYQPSEAEELYLNQLRQAIEQLSAHQHQFVGDINQDIFVAELIQTLADKGVGQRFLAGAVNFCTLMPMRSIPFKHVCVLGMNDSDYPRQSVPVGFDLMRHTTARKGDRSRRHDDRYLFLEAILSAQTSLYISYHGYSHKTNAPLSPSLLLSELLTYCEETFCLPGQRDLPPQHTRDNLRRHIVTEHQLQPYSPRYFASLKAYERSFSVRWLEVAKALFCSSPSRTAPSPVLPPLSEEDDWTILELEELIRFFMNPAKGFFQRRFNASLDLRIDQLVDEEPFALDSLAQYQLAERVLQTPGLHKDVLTAQGVLPIGEAGGVSYARLLQSTDELQRKVTELSGGASAVNVSIEVEVGGVIVQGNCNSIYRNNLLRWRPGKIRAKDKIALYLEWLALCAGSELTPGSAAMVAKNGVFSLSPLTKAEALQRLACFVSYYQLGVNQHVLFFPETSWQWLAKEDKGATLNTFMGNDFSKGEAHERHVQRMCPDLSTHFEAFTEVSEALLGPLFNDECKHAKS